MNRAPLPPSGSLLLPFRNRQFPLRNRESLPFSDSPSILFSNRKSSIVNRKSTSLLLILLFTLLACGKPPQGKGAGEVTNTSDSTTQVKVETVVGGLEVPWSIVFLPDGRMLITERPGRVRIVENGTLRPQPIAVINDVEQSGESGLMGLAIHPRFSENGWVYLSYAYSGGSDQMVRVVRYRMANDALADRQVIIEGIPAARFHAGCRIRFGPDGKLYITTGDATDARLAQQMNSLAGKTLRLNDDGSVPPDNPFVGQGGTRPEIWSYGHRNSQGLDWQPGSGLQFQTEHGPSGFDGPRGGDEVNIVERGKNYGWPTIHHDQSRAGMESPLLEYTPAVAPGGGSFYTGDAFPNFKGNFFFTGLVGECMIRVVLDGRRVVRQERMFLETYGRLRDVVTGPDGYIYFATSNRDGRGNPASDDDRIMRLVPAR